MLSIRQQSVSDSNLDTKSFSHNVHSSYINSLFTDLCDISAET